MSRTNLYIEDSGLSGAAGQHLSLVIPASGPAIPGVAPFVPSTPNIGALNTTYVDFTYGDDTKAAANPGRSTIYPYRSFSNAWTYIVGLANSDSSQKFCLRLRNPNPDNPLNVGSTPQLIPTNHNVSIRGDGADVTVFTSTYDYLTFVPTSTSSFTLDIGDLTLKSIFIRGNPASSDSDGNGFPNCLFLNGNGTTHIRERIDVVASAGGAGSSVSTGSIAPDGRIGGSMKGVRIKGFVATVDATPEVHVLGGDGGIGGNANVFPGGEYGDIPSYGTPGNGGTNGTVDNVLIEDMDCLPYNFGGGLNPVLGGWTLIIRPGVAGNGGQYIGGPNDNVVGGSSGSQSMPGYFSGNAGYATTALIARSLVARLDSSLPSDNSSPGYMDVTLASCMIGYDPNASRAVVARNAAFVSGCIHPTTSMTIASTTNSGIITDALYC